MVHPCPGALWPQLFPEIPPNSLRPGGLLYGASPLWGALLSSGFPLVQDAGVLSA